MYFFVYFLVPNNPALLRNNPPLFGDKDGLLMDKRLAWIIDISYVCDATRISINKHELIINIYETFMGICGHLCDAVGKEDTA